MPSSDKNLEYVQYLLHMCYWYKSEARFVECWHTLNSAIREAQELGKFPDILGVRWLADIFGQVFTARRSPVFFPSLIGR